MRQETDKSAAVATVVAAVDLARVREPVLGAVEQTAQRTTTTAVHIQPAPEQVGLRAAGCACVQISQAEPVCSETALSPPWPRLPGHSELVV